MKQRPATTFPVVLLLSALLLNPARAGDREWARWGKTLTVLIGIDLLHAVLVDHAEHADHSACRFSRHGRGVDPSTPAPGETRTIIVRPVIIRRTSRKRPQDDSYTRPRNQSSLIRR